MDRRTFSALLPMLFAAPALAAKAQAQTPGSPIAPVPTPLARLASGQYLQGEPSHPNSPRVSRSFLRGLLPDNIRLESHVTVLAPGAPAEPVEHHKHSEIWLVREGTVTLMASGVEHTLHAGDMGLVTAGDNHWVTNASKTESASYFILAVGPPE